MSKTKKENDGWVIRTKNDSPKLAVYFPEYIGPEEPMLCVNISSGINEVFDYWERLVSEYKRSGGRMVRDSFKRWARFYILALVRERVLSLEKEDGAERMLEDLIKGVVPPRPKKEKKATPEELAAVIAGADVVHGGKKKRGRPRKVTPALPVEPAATEEPRMELQSIEV